MRYRRASYRYIADTSPLDVLEPPRIRLAHTHWRPPADVYETPGVITVTIELAGVDPDELEVVLFEDALTVAGSRRVVGSGQGRYHAAQIRQGPFRLDLRLPGSFRAEGVDVHA